MKAKKLENCPECGAVLTPKDFSIPRSNEQHKAFYRMVGIALDNWPESHPEFQPEGMRRADKFEDMRAWLLCEAGHRYRYGPPWKVSDLREDDKVLMRYSAAMMAAARLYHGHVWSKADVQGNIHIVHAKSIAFEDCPHEQFKVIFDTVQGIIEATLDIKIVFDPRERATLKKMGIDR